MSEKSMYQQLAEVVGTGDSKYIPKIFQTLADENEARLLLAASPPATAAELAEKTGLAEEEIERMVGPLFAKGLLFKSKKPDGIRYYRVRQLLQMHDATAVMIDAPQEMLDLWKVFMAEEFDRYSRMIEDFLPQAAVRVIPVNVSITPESRIMAFDDVKNIVEKADNLAVTKCSCRVIDGACGKPLDVCIQVGKAADYAIERGTGRKLEKNETLELLKMCEEEGLVHVSDNKQSLGHVICNCCKDCCLFWPSVRTGQGKLVSASRFAAQIDSDNCSSCETCVDRCYFDAISMTGVNDSAAITEEKCMGCGLCLVTCPEDAISLKEVRPADFIPS